MQRFDGGELLDLPLERLSDAENVRQDDDRVDQLAASLHLLGQTTPIIVAPDAQGRDQIISGRRRVRAARRLKWKTIRGFRAANLDEATRLMLGLTDNTMHQEMQVPDIVDVILRLKELTGQPASKLSKLVGVSPAVISQAESAMAQMSSDAKALLAKAKAKMFIWFEIRKLPAELQSSIASRCLAEGWTRDELQRAVREEGRPTSRRLTLRIIVDPDAGYDGARHAAKQLLAKLTAFERQGVDFKLAPALLK